MKLVFYSVIVVLFSSCSANWHLKKAIAKKPSILKEGMVINEIRDTVFLTTENVLHDTVVKFTTDTIRIEKGRGRAIVVVDTLLKEIFVEIECQADTVWKEVILEQTVLRPEVVDRKTNWRNWALIAMAVFIIIQFIPRQNRS
jgi:hypothetical protein